MVKKPNGEWRKVVDFRKVNAVSETVVVPIPKINDMLNALGGAYYVTSLDLRPGFFQIPLAKESQPLTAFTFEGESWCFRRMPMGCKSSAACFQLAMQMVLRGLTWEHCLVYIDDIIIFSKGGKGDKIALEEHLNSLRMVLGRIRAAGLSLKLAKCQFACDKLPFLGHVVSRDGIHCVEKTLKKIQNLPTPKNAKQVRGLVNLCGYYRRFIPNMAALVGPLTRLTGKAKFEWTDECQRAFEALKSVGLCDNNPGVWILCAF